VRLQLTFWESNMSVDVLAKHNARAFSNLVILNSPLIELWLVLLAGVMGVSYSHA